MVIYIYIYIPSGYLTVRHGKLSIEIDGLRNLKMGGFSMAKLLNNQRVFLSSCDPLSMMGIQPTNRPRFLQ